MMTLGLALLCLAHPPAHANAAQETPSSSRLRTAEDKTLSPFTGYTRGHWLEINERLLAGILPHFDRRSGLPELRGVPGDRGAARLYPLNPLAARLQAMERIMMLAVYYTAATGRDRVPGYPDSVTQPFRTAITRMSDPSDPLYCKRTDPSVYYGSETALAIALSPRFFWEPLTPREKENVLDLLEALTRMPSYDNNHHFFHMMPVPLLERHGRPSNRAHYTEIMERILGWHRGDGWFVDGNNQGFDHYNFWGFQLYANAVCHMDGPWRKTFGDRFRDITARFFKGLPYFFGRDGAPIPWGRSLAYRFADCAAIGWARLNGADPLAPGLSRRIASGCLRHFWDNGAMSTNGVLELGFRGPNAAVAESYLTDGTGYFAAQGLACLMIPETDRFWTDIEQPMPADGEGGTLTLPGAEMVVRVSPIDGEARLFPVGQHFTHHGRWQRGTKYCQHAYSSAIGWCALGEGGEDLGAGRTGYAEDGQPWTYRDNPSGKLITRDHVASAYPLNTHAAPAAKSAPRSQGEIVTHTFIGDAGEVHVFWHTREQAVRLYLGGYGINVHDEGSLESRLSPDVAHIRGASNHSLMKRLAGPPGTFEARTLRPREGFLHSHLFGGIGAFPFWRSDAPVGPRVPVAIYVDGARGREPTPPALRAKYDAGTLHLEFDGQAHTLNIGE